MKKVLLIAVMAVVAISGWGYTIDEVIANEAAVLALVKENAQYIDDSKCIDVEKIEELSQLPANFQVNDLDITFVFDKCEIACEESGKMGVTVSLAELVDHLTPLGKRLFLGDGKTLPDVKQQVVNRVNALIKKHLRYGTNGANLNGINAFMTREYNEVEARGMASVGEDDIWLDFDPWIDAQDFDRVSFTVKNVYTINKDNAIVELEVRNFGTVKSKYLSMKRQDGVFKIDDFTTSGTTMRKIMIVD